ncbi:hypothetical protein HanPI659440_Chr07g0254481 [Helianthus annuus]|nr:hypothetical protein HanPI659440_Chr07g0254481 [Helianthus annuus]
MMLWSDGGCCMFVCEDNYIVVRDCLPFASGGIRSVWVALQPSETVYPLWLGL